MGTPEIYSYVLENFEYSVGHVLVLCKGTIYFIDGFGATSLTGRSWSWTLSISHENKSHID